MGRRQGSSVTRRGIAAALALALWLPGCGANPLTLIMFGGAVIDAERGAESSREPELEPSRRVHEQDCTRAVQDASANLKCR